jgi:hypothetical protein
LKGVLAFGFDAFGAHPIPAKKPGMEKVARSGGLRLTSDSLNIRVDVKLKHSGKVKY